MFLGHNFKKLINDNWVIDLTEFYGYKVIKKKSSNDMAYTKAFKVNIVNGKVTFEKYVRIPAKVLQEAKFVVEELMGQM